MQSEADYRLPRTVIPSHYELTLTPDLGDASFAGHGVVDVALVEPVSEIVLNTAELTLHDVAETIHAHPTLPEVVAEAAHVAMGQGLHI